MAAATEAARRICRLPCASSPTVVIPVVMYNTREFHSLINVYALRIQRTNGFRIL